ncbi:DUF3379 family protein [Marinihelvus fidelis]|nr:DUF3379 family protein [Marinihelvus fidelis]
MDQFEQRLEAALKLPVDDTLVDSLLPPADTAGQAPPARRGWAIAASVLVMLSVGVIAWQASRPAPSLEEYILAHYRHDGATVLARAGDAGVDPRALADVLGRFNLEASAELASRVTLVKFCPTPKGRGAHMVVQTDTGPVTVIVIPEMVVEAPRQLAFDEVTADIVALRSGTAAIIGPDAGMDVVVGAWLRDGLVPSGTGA